MIITPHVLAGAAFATQVSNPFAIIFGALALHHVLDLTPHWDYDIKSSKRAAIAKIVIDIAVVGIAMLILLSYFPLEKQFDILLGGFFGILPDGFVLLHMISKGKYFNWYIKFHHFWHWMIIKEGQRPNFAFGLSTQVFAVLASLYFFLI